MKHLLDAPSRPSTMNRRRWAAVVLVALVALVHLGLMLWVEDLARLGAGAADTSPARIDVAFVRELAQAEPPPVAPVAPRPAPAAPAAAAPVPPAASAPLAGPEPVQAAASSPAEVAAASEAAAQAADRAASAAQGEPNASNALARASEPADSAPAPSTSVAAAAPAPGAPSLPAAAAPSAPAAPAFDWPPSTRLSYNLVGDYRGPVQGKARVEWLRSGNRYQVHLDVRVGADFAPLLSRRMSSDGLLTEDGLKPQRYDEETRVLLREVRRQTILFEPERIVLPRGGVQPLVTGVQDTASQFVQLTWMFTLQPQLLRPGQTVEVPLALARRVDRWVYDVVGEEVLDLPVGPIKAWYLKPRLQSKTNSDLSVETWFAPSLQYLPVRIRIRQDEASFIDLMLERLPQQASASDAPPPRRIVPP
jgi:hypothetical protein